MERTRAVVTWTVLICIVLAGVLLVPSSGQSGDPKETLATPAVPAYVPEREKSFIQIDRKVDETLGNLEACTNTFKKEVEKLYKEHGSDLESLESGIWHSLRTYGQNLFLLRHGLKETQVTALPLLEKQMELADETAQKGKAQAATKEEHTYWLDRLTAIKELCKKKQTAEIRVSRLIGVLIPDPLELRFESEFQVSRIEGHLVKLEHVCDILDEFVNKARAAYTEPVEEEHEKSEKHETEAEPEKNEG